MASYMQKTMLTLLLCLCVGNSTLRVIANEPSFCDTALICKPCMWQSCTDEKYMEWFGLMCCDSEAAQHTECRQLCENSSLRDLIRYNPYTNKSEKLCPTYHILYECEISHSCVEGMCTHPVESEVFKQQCLSKLGYEQLVTPKCKKLALRYYRSTMSSPKLVNATANSNEGPPDNRTIINSDYRSTMSSPKLVNATANSNEGPPDNRTIINSAGMRTTTLLAVDVFKPVTPTPAYPATTQHVTVGLILL
ncbi:uncharacterized protein LOC128229890 isoform X2 [Mya arenaria]|uniref:uncharacterized protein LOC128229890 isoform X2 n=1 Tax=Mya arenaria TaxID=6604 RepID=UPI0022E48FE5|nr:uncharacterized protein LOC128229890 isoform X2 [Mya arenaria]